MSAPAQSPVKIILGVLVILAVVGYLSFTGVRDTKSYYVTISELNAMGGKAYTRHLRVAGQCGSGEHQAGGDECELSRCWSRGRS